MVQRDGDVQTQLAEYKKDVIRNNTPVRIVTTRPFPEYLQRDLQGRKSVIEYLRNWSLPKGTCMGGDKGKKERETRFNGRKEWCRD